MSRNVFSLQSSLQNGKGRFVNVVAETIPNASLPDDLLLNCFTRVSRLYYPTLSLVSKRFRSLLSSPELYKERSSLGRTESCIYVCLLFYPEFHWFTLCRKPNQTLTSENQKEKSSEYVLATLPIPIPRSPPAYFSSLVSFGSNIYNIGGYIYEDQSSSVSILDCRNHKWREAPNLRMELKKLSARVVNQKIYVAGCYIDEVSGALENSFEVLDTETQIWDHNPIPCPETRGVFYDKTVSIDGKFHVVTDEDEEVVAYIPKEGRWSLVRGHMSACIVSGCYCEIENVLYSSSHEVIDNLLNAGFEWYDTKVRIWRKLKGLVGLPEFSRRACVRLVDRGGKMVVFWDEILPLSGGSKKMIWCAEITLERTKSSEVWGKVEWFDHVLTVPTVYEFVKAIAATL